MRHVHGLFLSQPITTLENVSYISLAQPELKKLWIISQTSYLTVAIINGQCQYMLNAEYAHEMTARERLRSILVRVRFDGGLGVEPHSSQRQPTQLIGN